jgi:hypothetical protein
MLGTASIGGWKHCCYSNLINEEAVMVTGKIFKKVNSTDSTNRSFSKDDVVFCNR